MGDFATFFSYACKGKDFHKLPTLNGTVVSAQYVLLEYMTSCFFHMFLVVAILRSCIPLL